MKNYELIIQGRSYELLFEDNKAVHELSESLPLTIEMNELNGNEKFYYLPKDLPTHSEPVKEIKKGDVMLYGSNCLVLFYEDFRTHYSYTRLGKVVGFEEAASKLVQKNSEVKIQVVN